MENELLQFIDPKIAASTIAYTSGVVHGIGMFYRPKLSNNAKRAIACVIGVFLAFAQLPEAITLETAINAILKGGISAITASLGYMAAKDIGKPKSPKEPLNLPV